MSAAISEMIDPTRVAKYTVRLGEGLLADEDLADSNYSTVICKSILFKMLSIIVPA